jgi:hypothetical protein
MAEREMIVLPEGELDERARQIVLATQRSARLDQDERDHLSVRS